MKLVRVLCLVEMSKSSFYYRSVRDDSKLILAVREIAFRFVFYGYRRIHAVLVRSGIAVNIKKVYRIYRSLQLQQPKRISKPKRQDYTPAAELPVPERPGQIWAIDFRFNRLADGRQFKTLTCEDAFDRNAVAAHPEFSITGKHVGEILESKFEVNGKPEIILSDNGPEFRSKAFAAFCLRRRIKHVFIPPASPYFNGRVERFNRSLNDECLALNVFDTLSEAEKAIRDYLKFYNSERPHQTLGYRTPEDFRADFLRNFASNSTL
jgi:putative transposase